MVAQELVKFRVHTRNGRQLQVVFCSQNDRYRSKKKPVYFHLCCDIIHDRLSVHKNMHFSKNLSNGSIAQCLRHQTDRIEVESSKLACPVPCIRLTLILDTSFPIWPDPYVKPLP